MATVTTPKRSRRIAVSSNMETMLMQFTFIETGKVISLDVTKVIDKALFDTLPETAQTALFHGLNQKCRDCYAGDKTDADAEKSLVTVIENVESGKWKGARVSSEATAKAIAEVNATIDSAVQMSTTLFMMQLGAGKVYDVAQIAGIVNNPKVAEKVIEELRTKDYFKSPLFDVPVA